MQHTAMHTRSRLTFVIVLSLPPTPSRPPSNFVAGSTRLNVVGTIVPPVVARPKLFIQVFYTLGLGGQAHEERHPHMNWTLATGTATTTVLAPTTTTTTITTILA